MGRGRRLLRRRGSAAVRARIGHEAVAPHRPPLDAPRQIGLAGLRAARPRRQAGPLGCRGPGLRHPCAPYLPPRRADADAFRRGLPRPNGHGVPAGLQVQHPARHLRVDSPAPGEVRHRGRHKPLLRRQGDGHRRYRRDREGRRRPASNFRLAPCRSGPRRRQRQFRSPIRRSNPRRHGIRRPHLRPRDAGPRHDVSDPRRRGLLRDRDDRGRLRRDLDRAHLQHRHHEPRRCPARDLLDHPAGKGAGRRDGPGDRPRLLGVAALPPGGRRRRQDRLDRPQQERRHRRRPGDGPRDRGLRLPRHGPVIPDQDAGLHADRLRGGRAGFDPRARHIRGPVGSQHARDRRRPAPPRRRASQPGSGHCRPEPGGGWRCARHPGRVRGPAGHSGLPARRRPPGRANPCHHLDPRDDRRSRDVDRAQLLRPARHGHPRRSILIRGGGRRDRPGSHRYLDQQLGGDQGQLPAAQHDARPGHGARARPGDQGGPGARAHPGRHGLDRLRHRNQRGCRFLGRAAAVPAGRDRPGFDTDDAGHGS